MSTRRLKIALALLVMSISGTVSASFGPGVWEQLETRGHTIVQSKILALEISDQMVVVEFDGGRTKLCATDSSLTDQRVAMLREAFQTGATVDLAFQGPWNTCLKTISQRRTNSKS